MPHSIPAVLKAKFLKCGSRRTGSKHQSHRGIWRGESFQVSVGHTNKSGREQMLEDLGQIGPYSFIYSFEKKKKKSMTAHHKEALWALWALVNLPRVLCSLQRIHWGYYSEVPAPTPSNLSSPTSACIIKPPCSLEAITWLALLFNTPLLKTYMLQRSNQKYSLNCFQFKVFFPFCKIYGQTVTKAKLCRYLEVPETHN